jgi:hypothetical protein
VTRPLLIALVWVLAAGCGGKGKQASSGEGAAAPAAPISLAPVTDDSTLAGVAVDTTAWVMLGGIDHGAPLRGRPGEWAIDYGWLHVSREPGKLYTVVQMDSLERAGVIDSTTAVGFVWYRIAVSAPNVGALRQEAMAHRPSSPPASVRRALDLALQGKLTNP